MKPNPNEHLIRGRDEALAAMRADDAHWSDLVATRAERDAALADLSRLRPVVEAAERFCSASDWRALTTAERELRDAVRASVGRCEEEGRAFRCPRGHATSRTYVCDHCGEQWRAR